MQRRGGQALLLFIPSRSPSHRPPQNIHEVRCVEPGMAWSRSPLHELSAERQKAPHTALLRMSNHYSGNRRPSDTQPLPSASRSQKPNERRPPTPSTSCRFSFLRAVPHLQNRHFIYRYAQYIYDVYVYAIVNLDSVAYEQWGYAEDRISSRSTDVPTS